MQSRQVLFYLVVGAATLVQISFAAPASFDDVSREAQALSQAGGLNLVAIDGKEQAAKAADNLPMAQQAKEAGVENLSEKDKAGQQAGNPQQLADTKVQQENGVADPKDTPLNNENTSHQKRNDPADAPSAEPLILKATPEEHQEDTHQLAETSGKETSAGAKSTPPSQQASSAGAKESSITNEANAEAKEQDTAGHKDANRLRARSAAEDKDMKNPQSVPSTKSSGTQSSSPEADEKAQANTSHASGAEEKQDPQAKDGSKILAQAPGSEDKQDSQEKEDNKSTAHASGSEIKSENAKDDAKILVEVPDHATGSEDKEVLHKRDVGSAAPEDKQGSPEKGASQSFAAMSSQVNESADKASQALDAVAHVVTPYVSASPAMGKDTQEEQAAAAAEHV